MNPYMGGDVGMGGGGGGAGSGGHGCVLMVYGLHGEKMNCDR